MRIFSWLAVLAMFAACDSSEKTPAADESNPVPVPVSKTPAPPIASLDASLAAEAAPKVDAELAAAATEAPAAEVEKPKTDNGPSDEAVQEAIMNTEIVAVLTGAEGEGGAYAKFSDTDQGASLSEALDHAKGKPTRRSRGATSGQISKAPESKPAENKNVSRLKIGGVDDLSDSSLTPDTVARRIRSKYLAGIKRCHGQLLKTDPKAGGKVTITFTVGATGKVAKAAAKGFDPTVDKCIKGLALAWRFPAPKDDSGKPTTAKFILPILLKPGS